MDEEKKSEEEIEFEERLEKQLHGDITPRKRVVRDMDQSIEFLEEEIEKDPDKDKFEEDDIYDKEKWVPGEDDEHIPRLKKAERRKKTVLYLSLLVVLCLLLVSAVLTVKHFVGEAGSMMDAAKKFQNRDKPETEGVD